MRAVEGGGALTSAIRSVICDSAEVVSRIASSTSRRICVSSRPGPLGAGSASPDSSSESAKKRYPASVGTRPAEVWGWVSSPCFSSAASSARTVEGPHSTSARSAIACEPTGRPSSR